MGLSDPYRILIILVICLWACSLESHAVSEEKLREIEKIRAELSEALENYEDPILEGVIVQPEWTRTKENQTKEDAKVVVTKEKLAEIKRLRDEISKAAAMSDNNSTKQAKNLQKKFVLQQRGKTVLEKMVGNSTAEQLVDDEMVGAATAADEVLKDSDGPNIIELNDNSVAGIDIEKLQRLDFAKRRTKDMLRLKSIEEDFLFTLGEDVLEWLSIWHGGKEYFVGRRLSDLLVVRVGKTHTDKATTTTIEVGQAISYMDSYSFWNVAQQQQEGVLLVATADKVIWYRYNATTQSIVNYWEWSTGRHISGLTYFSIETNQYLAVSTNESSRAGYFNINIYQFVLESREFWIVQRLQLQHPCAEVTVHDTGRDIVLAVAQNNSAAVYFFNPRAVSTPDFIRFELRHTIASERIETITAFKMGGRSYFALGGMQPQILLYQQGELVAKTIFDQNFGLVELFFPIPVRTYRDDLILLVQHRVDFSSHTLTVLETLIWNGDYFEASIPVPCHQGSHIAYGVSCMLDVESVQGLKGATLLKREHELAILVPRHQAESGLFYLHTEILASNSELLDLQDVFAFLKDWVKEQDGLIMQAQSFLAQPLSTLSDVQTSPDFSNLELLSTPELEFTGDIGEIYVNDYLWTEEDSVVHLDTILQKIELLARDILPGSRHKRDLDEDILPRFDALDFDVVEVKDLLIEQLNNEPFYIQDGELNLDGLLNMQSLEVVERTTHGLDEDHDVMLPNLDLDGDITFASINGVPWEEFKRGLVFRNQPLTLDEFHVEGEVILEDNLIVNNLNELKFPEEYLWSSGPANNTVHAEKIFVGSLAANAVDITGTLNRIHPHDAITLTEAQNLTGLVTFANLEIIHGENTKETAEARNLNDNPSSPTLLDSNFIEPPATFTQLEVRGDVIINGQLLDKKGLAQLIADIVQRPTSPEERIDIQAAKKFGTVEFPVDFRVESKKINNLDPTDFVTLHTEQELDFSELTGYVYFNNLTLGGTYDGVNITALLENSIKIDEPQVSEETQLNFVDTFVATELNVTNSLNGVPIAAGYQTVLENMVLKELIIDTLNAKLAQIPGDIAGSGSLNGQNIGDYLKQRSWTEPTQGGNVFLDELTLQSGLHTDALHGLRAEFLLNFLAEIDELPEMILDGKIQVDHVVVTGDVQVHKLNGDNFDEDIQLTAVWLNRPNYLSTNLQFEQPLELQDNIYCEGAMNGENLQERIDDMIFVDAENVTLTITAPKYFSGDVRVADRVKVSALNGIIFERIATKRNIVDLTGNFTLSGNVFVQDLELFGGQLNDFAWKNFSQLLGFDSLTGTFVLRGETLFSAPMVLQDLNVAGHLNSFRNVSQFFNSLVYKNNDCLLEGKTTFKGRVAIEEGANIKSLNDLNLMNLLKDIVYISETRPVVVKTPSIFIASVNAINVAVRESLMSSNLNSCPLDEWLQDTMRVDRDETIPKFLRFGAGSLDGNEFFASFINDVDLSRVITLHTLQNLTEKLNMSKVFLDLALTTNLPINGVDLQAEYENTLMIHGNQHIRTPLTMQSCRVWGDLQTNVPINNAKDLRQVALLQESLEFRSPLFLQNISAKNLYTNDLVSGINLDQWHKTALLLNARTPQWITGNWSVRSLTVESPSERSLAEMHRTRRSEDNFSRVCQRVVELLQRSSRSPCFVKYIEEAFELALATNETIQQVFPLHFNSEDFLLLNVDCYSHFFKWNISRQDYQLWSTFESGSVDQLILVLSESQHSTFMLITNAQGHSNCSRVGLNSWSLNDTNVIHIHSFGRNYSSIHLPHLKSSHFYALNQSNQQIHEFNLFDDVLSNSWQLGDSTNGSTDFFKFLPISQINSSISLTNGHHIFVLIKSNATHKVKRASTFRLSMPLVSLDAMRDLMATSESSLQPANETAPTRKLDFTDFEQVLVRILHDLNWRLGVEINITQLSIPESDLYDLNLVQDFIDIMQELSEQQIFPATLFAAVNLEKLQLPENPAQVLAARTVQIIWPVIVEIEEVHSYLKEGTNHTHPICARIVHKLGLTIRDILLLAYKPGNTKSKPYMKDMVNVIKRIRKLQATLDIMAKNITVDIERQKNDSVEGNRTQTAESTLQSTRSLLDSFESNETSARSNETMDTLSLEPLLLADWLSETLVFEVGSASEPRTITAVVTTHSHVASSDKDVIKLFTTVADENRLFQVVLAHKPRSLISLRIRDETLLAFMESSNVIRVLIYRGVEGFVEFVKFTTKEKMLNTVAMSVNGVDISKQRHFIVANFGHRLQFYEAVIAGDQHTSQETYSCA